MIYVISYEGGDSVITISNPTPQELALLRKAKSLADLYNHSWKNFEGTNLYREKKGRENEEKEEGV